MESSEHSQAWATKVRESYDRQLSNGVTPPVLTEDLLWQAPGVDDKGKNHLEWLEELGITIKFNPAGIQLVPVT